MNQPAASGAAASHPTVELLSAHLDRELTPSEAGQVEEHLAHCETCRSRFAGLSGVAASVGQLRRLAPPSTLGQDVARRIALAGERDDGLLERLENRLARYNRQSTTLSLFAVVFALAVILFLLSHGVERSRQRHLPVIFTEEGSAPEVGAEERRQVGDRVFLQDRGRWIEEGIDAGAVARSLAADSPAGEELLALQPELGELLDLGRPVVLLADGEILELQP